MSKKVIEKIKNTASSMLESNKNLHDMQKKYEDMGRMRYELPSPLKEFDWIRPIIDSSPYDAKRGVKRALANLMMNINIHPVTVLSALEEDYDDESKAARLKANEWEKTIKWVIGRTAKRRAAFYDSVIDSGALYHEIVGQIIHIPTQIKAKGGLGDAKERAALRFGEWAIRQVNPQSVNVDYSDYMPERVFCCMEKTAQEIVDFWGDSAKEISAKIREDGDYANTKLIECDYVDYENRLVWVVESHEPVDSQGVLILGPEPWLTIKTGDNKGKPVPFLNWVAVAGGTDIDALPEYQRQPLFFPVVMTEQWVNTNIMGTIEMAKAIATANAPEQVITSPRGEDGPSVDYDEPGGVLRMMPGETYQQLRQMGLDPALMEAYDRLRAAIQRATVADVLVTGQPMGNIESFAAYNLQVQVAIASLGDIKHLAERYYESVIESILLLTYYTGGKIVGYGDGLDKYTIDSESIDPDSIYITVELKPDVPVDRQQRITSAIQMADRIPYDPIKILEFLGEADPEGAIRGYKLWQMDQAEMSGRLSRIQAEATGELEQLRQMVGAMQQQMAQIRTQRTPGRGIPGVEGEMFNPAQGGLPPAMAAPGATREMQRGTDNRGTPVAEVF